MGEKGQRIPLWNEVAKFVRYFLKVERGKHRRHKKSAPRHPGLRKQPTLRAGRHHWFSREMTSEKRAQKFHTDDASLLKLVVLG